MAAQFQLTARRVTIPDAIPANILGESPTWDSAHSQLWWVDIIGEVIYVARPCANDALDFDRAAVIPVVGQRPGFVVNVTADESSAPADTDVCAVVHPKTKKGAALKKKLSAPIAVESCAKTAPPTNAVAFEAIRHREHDGQPPRVVVWGSQGGMYAGCLHRGIPWVPEAGCPEQERLTQTFMEAFEQVRLLPFPRDADQVPGAVYRFNDGKVAPDGSLMCGVMMERTATHPVRKPQSGALVQFVPPLSVSKGPGVIRQAVPRVTVSNGMGWSPDHGTLYHVDTPTKTIQAYAYDTTTRLVDKAGRTFWSLPPELQQQGATLDGLCVDAAGAVWVALAGIGQVVRLSPDKQTGEVGIHGVVTVPGVKLTTSCCFGGHNLSTLYITTARGTSADQAKKCTEKNAGYIHAVNLEGFAKGLPPTRLSLEGYPRFTSLCAALASGKSSHL